MSQNVTYKPLCKIDIRHAYYLHPVQDNSAAWIPSADRPNALTTAMQEALGTDHSAAVDVAKDLEIIASKESAAFMNHHKMVVRQKNDGLELWIRAQKGSANSFRPAILFNAPFKLTFALYIKNSSFFNFTQHEDGNGVQKVWYFANTSGNRFGNTNYLNVSPPELSPPQNYASASDRVEIFRNAIPIDISALQLAGIRFKLEGAFNVEEFRFQAAEGASRLTLCNIQPAQMPAGLYNVRAFRNNTTEIAALQRKVFWNPGTLASTPFAVIEIFHQPESTPAAFRLLDGEQRLLSPTYTLWWQNRSLYWRYIFDVEQPAPDINNPMCSVRPEIPGNRKLFVSKERLPLLRRYQPMRYCVANGSSTEEILLPNPEPDRIYPENGAYFAEVYMGPTDYNKLIPNIT